MTRVAGRLLVVVCLSFFVGCAGPVLGGNQNQSADQQSLRSRNSLVEAEMKFVNLSGQTVNVYWLDYGGERKFYQTLRDGEFYVQPTYLTHPWLITDENGAAWEVHHPTEQPQTIEITAPQKK